MNAQTESLVSVPRPRIAEWLMSPIRGARHIYLQVIAASILINLFGLAAALFSMVIYNRIIPNGAIDSLVAISIGIFIVLIFDFILRCIRGYLIDVSGVRIDAEVGGRLFSNLINMNLAEKRGSTGGFASILREYESIREFFSSATVTALADVPFIVLYVAVIAMFGGWLALIPTVLVLLVLLTGFLLHPRLERLTAESMQKGLTKQGVLVETIGALETIKAVDAGRLLEARWAKAVVDHSETSLKQRLLNAIAVNLAVVAQTSAYILIVIAGVFLVEDGRLTVGALIACSLLAGRCVAPLSQIATLISRISHAKASYLALDRLFSVSSDHDSSSTDRYPTGAVRHSRFDGSIEFNDVTFSYPGSASVALDKVSFRIHAGERVAILGRMGSGKSSTTRLILGLYQPDSGSVLIDGSDIRHLHPEDLRSSIGVVLQDVVLFSGSIADNIRLGRDGVSDERLLDAAKASLVHSFVGPHPAGFGLELQDRGEGVSGGQRQAIAVARALVRDCSILLFDEPTSAMDVATEGALVEQLKSRVEGRTFVVATHRASLLSLVDRILVLDQGRLILDGPRDKVLASLGRKGAES